MTITFDSSALLSYYQSKYGGTAAATASGSSTANKPKAPTAPWEVESKAPRASDLVKSVMAGRKFVDPNSAQLDVKGASEDYRKLFGLFQGLNALSGLAERANTKGVSTLELNDLTRTFAAGMSQVSAYLDTLKLAQLRLARGESLTKDRTEVGVKRDDPSYTTAPVHTGLIGDEVAAFQGDVKFDISVTTGTLTKTTRTISIDLDDMGSTPRSMSNVVIHINEQLEAAGVRTRFAVERIPAEPKTVTAGGKTTTLPAGPDSFALKVKSEITETVGFSAAASAGSVYLAGAVGKDTVSQQLLKFQTDIVGTAEAPPPAFVPGDATFNADGRVFAKPLGKEIAGVRQTVTGPDGSVYALADVTAATDGQAIRGTKDVALIKYDSAGNVVFTRTLGASDSASGLALNVAADGKVAVAGSITGTLGGAPASLDSTKSDSFVTVFNGTGEELWTQRRAAVDEDEATAVAFGADGTVYVAGRARSNMPGAVSVGGYDGYLQAFSWNGKSGDASLISTRSTAQFGTAGSDTVSGISVEGSQLVLAGVENGHAVVRRFDLQADGSAVAGAVRDLGALNGGGIAGVSLKNGEVIVAGSTGGNGLSAGQVTNAYGGGQDGFVARLDASLSAGSGDRLTYLGGAGDSFATSMTVVDGKVWIAGTSKGEMPGSTAVGETDGFLMRLDASTGAQEWTRRFSGSEKTVGSMTVAYAAGGASVLDRLGLPTGTLTFSDSKLLTSNSSVRAGDQFMVKTSEGGRAQAVTIAADDTLQSLATKISRAAGFQVKVSVVKDGDYDKLEIKPLSDRSTVEIVAGSAGRDALEALGLSEGVVRNVLTGSAAKAAEKIYGLKFDGEMNLSTEASRKAAMSSLQATMAVIRAAYRDMAAALEPEKKAVTGEAPAYLTNQIANYTAALQRLTGSA